MGQLLQEELRRLPAKEVRGIGLMQAMVFAEATAKEFQSRCLERGLVVNAVDDNTVRLVPPLIVGEQEIERAMEGMRASL
jgi:acetylornithine/succinyldiaminopimelate/putrescine aminotransferase